VSVNADVSTSAATLSAPALVVCETYPNRVPISKFLPTNAPRESAAPHGKPNWVVFDTIFTLSLVVEELLDGVVPSVDVLFTMDASSPK